MRFFTRKKHQPPAVIIVALIDVLIVVLIFLMVTTTFKKPQPVMNLALPESTHATKAGASDNPPALLIIETNGMLRFGLEARPITVPELKTELIAEVAKNPKLVLALKADTKSPFGQIVRVHDAAQEAGVKSISFYVKPNSKP